MRSTKIGLLATAALACATFQSTALAASAQDVVIDYVRVTENGAFEIRATQPFDALCAQGGLVFSVSPHKNGVSADGAKALLSVALTAFSLEKPVDVVFDPTTSACFANEILIAR